MHTQKYRRLLQAGFTLIELIIVIVIIGIMAAVAIPAYTGLAAEARTGVLKGVAGTMAASAATNFALRSGAIAGTGIVAVLSCTAAATLVTLPTEVTVGAGALTNGTLGDCVLTHSGGGTYTVKIMGAT